MWDDIVGAIAYNLAGPLSVDRTTGKKRGIVPNLVEGDDPCHSGSPVSQEAFGRELLAVGTHERRRW